MHRAIRALWQRSPRVAVAALYTGQLWMSASVGYLLLLLLAGRRPPRVIPPAQQPTRRVVVLVPAHDEAANVASAVEPLRAQDYPAELVDVVVIADNCSDATASVAEAAGAVVWERHAPDAPGKPAALSWALDRLWRALPNTDVIVVVDSDCVASPNLCSTVVNVMDATGAEAVQVPYEVSNAEESPTAALRAAGFALKHVVRARGRARLGLSCGLFGTGMAFSTDLLKTFPLSESVTEDTELFVRLTLDAHRIAYGEGARITSPMPVRAEDAEQQQLRWETGNAELARSQLGRLAARSIRTGDRQALGAAAELMLPSQTVMGAGTAALLLLGAARRDRRLTAAAAATTGAQAAYVLGGLGAASGPRASYRALVHSPAFVIHRLKIVGRVASGRGAQSWVRTERRAA
jgi:1,2-diacylglycerol 3-beta-glucosyltransferase